MVDCNGGWQAKDVGRGLEGVGGFNAALEERSLIVEKGRGRFHVRSRGRGFVGAVTEIKPFQPSAREYTFRNPLKLDYFIYAPKSHPFHPVCTIDCRSTT